jgi:DNA-binding transcriptional ArsR family regulator
VEKDLSTLPPELCEALLETLSDHLAAQIYIAVTEHPGVTIAQIAAQIDEPPRRVRHQIDRMLEAGLVVVESVTPRGNVRQRHYRAVALAQILAEMDETFGDEKRRRLANSVARLIAIDVGRSLRNGTLGTRSGHAEVRIPAEVDERGWMEISEVVVEATVEMEDAAIRSAARLEAAGEPGIEVIAALLLFEGLPWEEPEGRREGPRRSIWTADEVAARNNIGSGRPPHEEVEPQDLQSRLHADLVEIMSDPLRTRVYSTVTERPGVTISQIAAHTGDPQRRVRHQIDRMVAVGLVEVEAETPRGNARQRHYRGIALPKVPGDIDESFDDERRRKLAGSVLRLVATDMGRAIRNNTLGTRPGHAEVRIPAEVDERGWRQISEIIERALREIEAAAIRSAARLEPAGEPGIEAIAALLLFESSPWEEGHGAREGPRRSMWSPEELSRHADRSRARS